MALARCHLVITDESGTIVDGASVEVRREEPGLFLAGLYSDRAGLTPLGNPFIAADGADAGFHVLGGAYKITATKDSFTRTWRYVPVGTKQESDEGDAGAGASETTLETFGGEGDGVTDCTPAFNAITAAGFRTLRLGSAKVYRLSSAVDPIHYGLNIIGASKSLSVLDFYQTTGSCLYYDGATDVGGLLQGFSIRNRGGATLTAAIHLESQAAGESPDFCILRDLNITGGTASDLFQYGILADGNDRTSAPVGIRDIMIENVDTFNTTVLAWEVRNGHGVRINGLICNATGTGGVSSGSITGADASKKSIGVFLTCVNMGDLGIEHANGVEVAGLFDDITVGAGASSFNIKGIASSVTVNSAASGGAVDVQSGCVIENSSSATRVSKIIDRHDQNRTLAYATGDQWDIVSETGSDLLASFTETLASLPAIAPIIDDGGALGSASMRWSDLFLASGAVVNWNNGNMTLTHSAGGLAFAGGAYSFEGGELTLNKTTAGSNAYGVRIVNVNSSSGEAHAGYFRVSDNNSGTIRAVFAAPGPLNVGTADQGKFDCVVENGSLFIFQCSSLAADGGSVFNMYDRSGNNDIRLHTNALSYFRGGALEARELRAAADVGGAASQNSLTNVSDLTANSTGVGSIKFKGTTSRDSSGFLKVYAGTTAYYVPVFSAITG